MKIQKTKVWPMVKKVYPDYNGRKFNIEFCDKITLYDTNWAGGTKNTYKFISSDGSTKELNIPAPWFNNIEGSTIQISEKFLVIRHSYFCGHDVGITIFAHPVYAPKWLTE